MRRVRQAWYWSQVGALSFHTKGMKRFELPVSHQQVLVPAAVASIPLCVEKQVCEELFQDAVEIDIVEDLFVNDAVIGHIFRLEPV